MLMLRVLLVSALLVLPAPASGTLGVFIPADTGWAASADSSGSVGDGVICGYFSKLTVTDAAIGMITNLSEGPVYDVVRRGLQRFTAAPTIDDIRSLQGAALRVLARLPESERRAHLDEAKSDGRFMGVHVLTVGNDALRVVNFTLSIAKTLEPIALDDELWSRQFHPASRVNVEIAGAYSFFAQHVERAGFAPLFAPIRGRHVSDIDLDSAADLSRKTVAAAIRATYSFPVSATAPGTVGGPVETVVLTAGGARWLHRLPPSLQDPQAAQRSCAAHRTGAESGVKPPERAARAPEPNSPISKLAAKGGR
jgi:hypothetical protein